MQQLKRTLRFLPPRPAWSTLHALAGCAALACAPSVLSAQCTEVTCQTPGNSPPTLEHQSVIVDGKIHAAVIVRDAEGNLNYGSGGQEKLVVNGLVRPHAREHIAGSAPEQAYRVFALSPVPANGRANSITFYACDALGACTSGEWDLAYTEPPPPPPPPPSNNTVDLEGNHGGFVPARHWAATASYATPAYVSRDQPRSIALRYSSEAVAPRGVVRVGTKTYGDVKPTACTIWLLTANGSRVPLRGGGTERTVQCYTEPHHAPEVFVETDESGTPTGAYTYTVVFRRTWPDGTTSEAKGPVRVLVVNDVASPYGSGWNLGGVQRLHTQSDGVLITNGDGSATFFEKGTSNASWVDFSMAVPSDWKMGGVADLTADGKPDIVWHNPVTQQTGAWEMNGTSFVRWRDFAVPVPSPWRMGGVADMTGDGKPDIVWHNPATQETGAWEMNGTSFVRWVGFGIAVPSDWKMGGVADLTGDGKPDIVWHNPVTQETGAWEMNGTSLVRWVAFGIQVPSEWKMGGVADMSADGKPDIVWHNHATQQTGAWEMNGTSFVRWVDFAMPLPSDWELGDVADLTADGRPDIVGHNHVTQQTGTWVMNRGGWTTPAGDFTKLTYDGTRYRREFPDKSVAVFNAHGLLEYLEDRFGSRTSYAWQSINGVTVLASVTDPAGRVMGLTYHGTGMLATVADPVGRTTRFGYTDGAKNLNLIEEADGRLVAVLGYDALHRLAEQKDASGAITHHSYDDHGRLQAVTLPAVTLADGRTTTRSLIHTATPTSLSIRDERSVLVTMTGIDSYGNVQRTESTGEVVQTATYDDHGRLTHSARTVRGLASGEPIRYTYSNVSGEVGVPLPGTVETSSSVTAYHRSLDRVLTDSVTRSTAGGSYTMSRNHLSGNPLRVDSTSSLLPDNSWGTTSYTYDAAGRLTAVRDPKGHISTIAYGSVGGMQNTASATAEGVTVTHTYDGWGRLIGTSDSQGRSTSTEYDLVNRVLSQTGPAGTVRYSIDIPARASTVTDQKGQTHTSRFNARGWKVSETDPRGRTSTFGYDQWGNVAVRTNRNGQTVRTEYDNLDRPTLLVSADERITYAYDPNHRWMAVANESSVDTLYADDKGRTTSEVSVRNNRRHAVTYTYSIDGGAADLTVQLAGQPGWTTRGALAFSGQITSIAAFNEGLHNSALLKYDTEGKPTSQSHRSTGLLVTQEYAEHRPTSKYTNSAALNPHASTGYEYDALGRIKVSNFHAFSREISYDAAGRLQRYVDSNYGGVQGGADYSYDAAGNPTHQGAVVETGNRVTQLDGVSLTYDEEGNTLSRGQRTFTWNTLGQLIVVADGSSKHVRYYYDGMGRRVRRVTTTPNAVSVTQYVYANGHLAAELDGAGTPIREFAYYPGTDRPYAMRRGTQVFKYIQSAVGDVVALADQGNGAAYSYKYDPWGNLIYRSDAGDPSQPLRYRAREYDSDTGLYQNRARWYDPQLGRFVSEDPIGIAGGLNVYAYAGNDPVNYSDPSGLDPCPNGASGCLAVVTVTACEAEDYWNRPTRGSRGWRTCGGNFRPYHFAEAFWMNIDVNYGTIKSYPALQGYNGEFTSMYPTTVGPTPFGAERHRLNNIQECRRLHRRAAGWTLFHAVGDVLGMLAGAGSRVPQQPWGPQLEKDQRMLSSQTALDLGGSYPDAAQAMANEACAKVPREDRPS